MYGKGLFNFDYDPFPPHRNPMVDLPRKPAEPTSEEPPMTSYNPNINPFEGATPTPANGDTQPTKPEKPATDSTATAERPGATPRRQRPDRAAYRNSAQQVEQAGRAILQPIQLLGSGLKGFMSELLGSRMIPFAGSAIAVFGLVLATESYWVGLGNGKAFIPKLGFNDGANLSHLQAILTSGNATLWGFVLVGCIALVCQLAEALPIRAALSGKGRGKKGRSPLAWFAVGLCYAIDIYCAHATYLSHGWSIPGVVWMLTTIVGAELGLALAKSA